MLSLVTLGVRDLAVARRFYVEGLGARVVLDLPEVVFLQVAHGVLLSLYGRADLAAETGAGELGSADRAPLAFAHNPPTEAEVDEVLARAVAAGGTLLVPARRADWGGWHGYVADPDGFRWEIAHNPGLQVGPDGTVAFGPAP